MGQKIHPLGFRVGLTSAGWKSRWFAADKNYSKFLMEDIKIRELLLAKLKPAGVTDIEIERSINKLKILISVARPGLLIGRGGTGLIELKKFLVDKLKIKEANNLEIVPQELKSADLSAYLIAQSMAEQLARRLPAQREI